MEWIEKADRPSGDDRQSVITGIVIEAVEEENEEYAQACRGQPVDESSSLPAYRMWRRETDFLTHVEYGFEAVLEELQCRLDHFFFLVGFQTEDLVNYSNVRVTPESDAIPVDELEDMLSDIKSEYIPFPDEDDQPTEAWREALLKHREFTRELSTGIRDVLKAELDLADSLLFTSSPYQVGNHLISLVMLVSRKDHDAQPHLSEAVTHDEHGVWSSFLHAVIDTFMQEYSEQMTDSEQVGSYLLRRRDAKELLRKAGAMFAHTGALAGRRDDPQDILKYGPFELFEACNVISSMHYEGAAGIGHIIVSDRGNPAVTVSIELAEPVSPDDYRKVRKLLAMCDDHTWLLLSGGKIYGLGKLKDVGYDRTKENVFVIRFVKHHCWELVHDDVPLMRTTYSEPRLPLSKFDQGDFEVKLRDRIPGITTEAVAKFVALTRTASSDAKHGAMLVISADAAGEVGRLGKQSFPVKPFALQVGQIPPVTSIDGAVFLDPVGDCHAVGIILDGRVSKRGDPARGARYNSAIRHADEHENCVLVVVSEDGMVNIVTQAAEETAGGRDDLGRIVFP